jgi:hypothetical protein
LGELHETTAIEPALADSVNATKLEQASSAAHTSTART